MDRELLHSAERIVDHSTISEVSPFGEFAYTQTINNNFGKIRFEYALEGSSRAEEGLFIDKQSFEKATAVFSRVGIKGMLRLAAAHNDENDDFILKRKGPKTNDMPLFQPRKHSLSIPEHQTTYAEEKKSQTITENFMEIESQGEDAETR
mmetsp:Transcript_8921/g.10050  ORF Transcript_8921/g.10050 Transcript_8921/m.10050 type:complete len:150 (+) Transcript_8921:34-483(+)